ncbi:hypothetical protein, partial [Pseudomonas sp. UBA6310]|uniref:hypothetical protein n=1 Tax=Pseudomonas sp. UBA6310 TaxID=1947327 RepID=UPI00257D9049
MNTEDGGTISVMGGNHALMSAPLQVEAMQTDPAGVICEALCQRRQHRAKTKSTQTKKAILSDRLLSPVQYGFLFGRHNW